MVTTEVGLIGLVALLGLLAARMPVGMAMLIVGTAGIWTLNGWEAAVATLRSQPLVVASNAEFIVIPLFVLMGNLASVSGLSKDLYRAAYVWIGHWRGGLASATILACTGFSALSGSSVACAVTMGRVSLPEMLRYKYDPRLATGAIAAGGTLGILVPPSAGFILYAILTEESIGRLFLAGVIPGLVLAALFMTAISLLARINPRYGPPGPKFSLSARLESTRQAGAMMGIVLITIGGIYAGLFTVNEAAGIGAFLAFVLVLVRRRLTWATLNMALLDTIRTTAFIFFILIGASLFTPFVALTGIPSALAETLTSLELPRLGTLLIILAAYVGLGMFLEGFAMLVLTLPIVHPIILALGYDPIWFGVLIVIVLEMGLITPPVGLNVFVVKGIAGDVPMSQIFRGVIPFWIAMLVCAAILIAVPQLALFLPRTMIG
jgi:tripartite ATP-independent transporter DctM subunit